MTTTMMVLKIDNVEHVVEYTASEDNVVVKKVRFFDVVVKISDMLKFKLQNAIAEILSAEVKIEDVNVCE